MQVLGLQFAPEWECKAANIGLVRDLVARRRPPPDSLLVLPEMFATGFSMGVASIAEGKEKLAEGCLRQLAAQFGCYVLGGLVSRGADGWGRNQAVLFSAAGRERCRYTKLHPFSSGGEDMHYRRGEQVVVVEIGGLRVCPLICYDLRFPEVFRLGRAAGADLFAVLANWPARRAAHWRALLRARAIENQAYVLGVNRTGSDPKVDYSGGSLLIDPLGEVMADARAAVGWVEGSADAECVREARHGFPVWRDRRAEFLGGLA